MVGLEAVFFVILAVALVVAAFAICGHLSRIAAAIEAQNRAYGIAGREAVPASREAA